jgi:beta-N-acetylhexosaminidase
VITTELIANDLISCGFNVNCSPSLDMNRPETSNVIGDRSFGLDVEMIVDLAAIVAETYLACAVMPVIKHMPGHGRAIVDSHHELPVVDTAIDDLTQTDFAPFKALNKLPWGMTAHIVFDALDKDAPATQSHTVIKNIIRGSIGFEGLLLSDDLNMNALAGDLDARAQRAIEAGVDIILHCSGDLDEMRQVAPHCPKLPVATVQRIEAASSQLGAGKSCDVEALRAELNALLPQE